MHKSSEESKRMRKDPWTCLRTKESQEEYSRTQGTSKRIQVSPIDNVREFINA